MSNKNKPNTELKEYLRAAGHEIEKLTPCPSYSDLLGYRSGTLDPLSHDEIQGHLMNCLNCRNGVLDAAAFFDPHPTGIGLAFDWKIPGRKAFRVWRTSDNSHALGAFLAIAAMLLITTGFSITWAVQFHSRAVSEETARRSAEQRKQSLEVELARLERPPASAVGLQKPLMNLGLHDIFPFSSVSRSGEVSPAVTIRTSPGSPFLVLLNAAGQPAYSSYGIEILDSAGNTAWKSQGLLRDSQQNYSVLIPSQFLNSGDYLIRISGIRDDILKPLAEYHLRLVVSP
jgi:hypothetical protein